MQFPFPHEIPYISSKAAKRATCCDSKLLLELNKTFKILLQRFSYFVIIPIYSIKHNSPGIDNNNNKNKK